MAINPGFQNPEGTEFYAQSNYGAGMQNSENLLLFFLKKITSRFTLCNAHEGSSSLRPSQGIFGFRFTQEREQDVQHATRGASQRGPCLHSCTGVIPAGMQVTAQGSVQLTLGSVEPLWFRSLIFQTKTIISCNSSTNTGQEGHA